MSTYRDRVISDVITGKTSSRKINRSRQESHRTQISIDKKTKDDFTIQKDIDVKDPIISNLIDELNQINIRQAEIIAQLKDHFNLTD